MANTDYVGVNHDLRVVNGGTIYLPKWFAANAEPDLWKTLALPDVYATGSVQKYPVGAVYREDCRTFVYGKWSATTTVKTAGYLVCTVATFKDLADSVISGAAGARTLIINYGGACAVNKYAGGFLGIKGTNYRSWQIISNTVQDGSNRVTFVVDGAIGNALATTDDVVLMENPYNEMRWYITTDTRPYIGATVSTITASYYAWIQTWGPHLMMSAFNSWEGADGNQFGVFAYHGSVQALPSNASGAVAGGAVVGACQQAGWFAAGCDPSSPADVSIGYPVWLTFRP